MKIITTWDPAIQAAAEQARADQLPDTAGRIEAAVVTLQNDTGSIRDYFLAVSGPATASTGNFTLNVVRTAYSMLSITASCDDLSMAADLLGPATTPVIGDDTTTTVRPLPAGFVFPFFTVPVSHYSACMNGFAQLHTSAAGVANNSFQNAAMPAPGLPNSVLAVLWDDLTPVPGLTHLRSAEKGSSPNRVFTIEWIDAAFLAGQPGPERLQFQAKLYETTGVIEFHYCSLALNGGVMTRLTGGTSTVGIENATGTDAMQFEFNTPNTVVSGGGVPQ